ncbi:hypothetical protein J2X46_004096 [Nocardioides sp. BE266]|nr:hypothetical protein [Nocardioides sp. BE266]
MTQHSNDPTGPCDRVHPHPVVALRDHLTQTMSAANQLRSVLATLDDPGRRFGEDR